MDAPRELQDVEAAVPRREHEAPRSTVSRLVRAIDFVIAADEPAANRYDRVSVHLHSG